MEILNDAIQMEIWRYVWRENYAQTIFEFAVSKSIYGIKAHAIQPESYLFENRHDHVEHTSHRNSPSSSSLISVRLQRCIIL